MVAITFPQPDACLGMVMRPRYGWATAYPVCDFWTEQIAASKKTNRSATFALSTWMPDQNWEP